MKLVVKQNTDNVVLGRKEVAAELEFTGATPKSDDVCKLVAKEVKGAEELTKVKHIYTEFGKNVAKVEAYIYADKASMDKVEVFRKKEKKKKK